MSFLAWPLETNRIRRDVTNNTFGTALETPTGRSAITKGGIWWRRRLRLVMRLQMV